MAILIGDTAPDFTADSTEGPIHFYDYIDGHWAVLFSHPKNFTPVCTTELGYTAKLKPEFEKRGVKVLGLSVDKLEDHGGWAKDIEETQGQALNFPLLADTKGEVARLYDAYRTGDGISERALFIVDKEGKLAYKDIHEVMNQQRDLVDVVARFEPKIVRMADERERPED